MYYNINAATLAVIKIKSNKLKGFEKNSFNPYPAILRLISQKNKIIIIKSIKSIAFLYELDIP